MRSVIMIAYFFPPEGNAGVYRPLRFVRHLPTMGWNASVISVDTTCYERYDPGLLSLVPSATEVVRVRGRDPWQSIQTRRAQRIQKKLTCASVETVTRLHGAQQASVRAFLREVVRRAEAWCYHPDMAMCWIRAGGASNRRDSCPQAAGRHLGNCRPCVVIRRCPTGLAAHWCAVCARFPRCLDYNV